MSNKKVGLFFILLGLCVLVLGLFLGVIGGIQYVFPLFLKEQLAFQKTRPLHVYLVINFIFSSATGCIYYFLPSVAERKLYSLRLASIHFLLQVLIVLIVVFCFFTGRFSGREYLEFPPWLTLLTLTAWVMFIINFLKTLSIRFINQPVYVWSWATGIVFFFITITEAHLWLLPYFHNNIVRDVTVQWKALGSMVGSWNMLVYGTAMYVMESITKDKKVGQSKTAFFFYFLSLTNLMFNWGHHTYIVPASPIVKEISYVISMTELLFIGKIIYNWRQSYIAAKLNYHFLPFRMFTMGDVWIFLNLVLALLISVPAINYYTHGTHITVAHAMGTTIGINTSLILGCLLFIANDIVPGKLVQHKKQFGGAIVLLNVSLLVFWVSLIGSGIMKSMAVQQNLNFAATMVQLQPWFVAFVSAGVVVLLSLLFILLPLIKLFFKILLS